MSDPRPGTGVETGLDQLIARLLRIGTYASVALLAAGVVLMAVAGHSPLEGGPPFDLTRLPGDLVALRPEGLLWVGLVAAIATPSARVAASLIAYLRTRDRAMAVVAAAILGVIILSVLLAIGTES